MLPASNSRLELIRIVNVKLATRVVACCAFTEAVRIPAEHFKPCTDAAHIKEKSHASIQVCSECSGDVCRTTRNHRSRHERDGTNTADGRRKDRAPGSRGMGGR